VDDADLAALADSPTRRQPSSRAAARSARPRRRRELRGSATDCSTTPRSSSAHGARDGRISYVNRAWERAFGYTADEARRLRPVDMVAPEDRGRYLAAGGARGRERCASTSRAPHQGRRRMVVPRLGDPLIASTPEGPVRGHARGYRDVTAERHAEAVRTRLAATLEASPDLVALATTQGRMRLPEPRGARLVGLGDDADLSALLLADLWPENDQLTMMNEAIPSALEAGAWEGEVELVAAGGERIPVSQVLVAHRRRARASPPYFVSAVMRDLATASAPRPRSASAPPRRGSRSGARERGAAAGARGARCGSRWPRAAWARTTGTSPRAPSPGTSAAAARSAWRRGPDVALAASVDETLAALLARVHPDDRDRVRDLVARAMDPAGDGRVHSEHRVLAPTARPRWTEVRGQVHLAGPARTPSRFVARCST
jgi:PAS domain S-box-containing protein